MNVVCNFNPFKYLAAPQPSKALNKYCMYVCRDVSLIIGLVFFSFFLAFLLFWTVPLIPELFAVTVAAAGIQASLFSRCDAHQALTFSPVLPFLVGIQQ